MEWMTASGESPFFEPVIVEELVVFDSRCASERRPEWCSTARGKLCQGRIAPVVRAVADDYICKGALRQAFSLPENSRIREDLQHAFGNGRLPRHKNSI